MPALFSRCSLVLLAFLLVACGSDQPEAAEPTESAEAAVTIDVEAILDQILPFLDRQTAVFEAMANAMEGVDDLVTANDVAERIHEEFTPQYADIYNSLLDWAEANLLTLSEEQQAELEASVRHADADGQLTRQFRAAENRFEAALTRMEQQMEMVYRRNPHLVLPIEEAMLAFGMEAERLMRDERMLALGRVMGDDSMVDARQTDEVGSPAWCQRMANTPQAQWTPNDGFAFASHCIGG